MPKFRKKPVEIEAVQWLGSIWDMPDWVLDRANFGTSSLFITTLEGTMEAISGDWIIRGVKGEVYPCKPDIFKATYDAVDERHP